VRNRLRRAAELCGQTPTEARGAFTIQLALSLGRLSRVGPGQPGQEGFTGLQIGGNTASQWLP
jgi:hypothetical protein